MESATAGFEMLFYIKINTFTKFCSDVYNHSSFLYSLKICLCLINYLQKYKSGFIKNKFSRTNTEHCCCLRAQKVAVLLCAFGSIMRMDRGQLIV